MLELVAFVPAAGVLALWLVPKWWTSNRAWVTGLGVQGDTAGDVYADPFSVLGTLRWIVVAITVLFAPIAETPATRRDPGRLVRPARGRRGRRGRGDQPRARP